MSSRRNTGHDPDFAESEKWGTGATERITALVQLRTLRIPDATLNELLRKQSPEAIAHKFRHKVNHTIERRVACAMRELARLQVGVVTVADPAYPATLHELEQVKPPLLFYRGNWNLAGPHGVAIIGTRRSTEYGNNVAESLASDLTGYGVTIVSGLALGIDVHAHTGALQAGGNTIAVLGCGVDVLYPRRNARIQEQIATEGLLISEFAPGEPAMPHHFLQRNRLIAKLSAAVIVVEAGLRSGSHNTVDWATKYNVEVFAVPGPIGREASVGTNTLILDGAKMLTSVRDVIDQLPWRATRAAASHPEDLPEQAALSGPARRVYEMLGPIAMHVDQIARGLGWKSVDALHALIELELCGVVKQLPGKRFARARLRSVPSH
jgi:DNA processing protein